MATLKEGFNAFSLSLSLLFRGVFFIRSTWFALIGTLMGFFMTDGIGMTVGDPIRGVAWFAGLFVALFILAIFTERIVDRRKHR